MTTVNNDSTTPNQVLSQNDILAEINSVVSKLEPLIPITPEQRQLLLMKFNWDIESLKNSLQEYADLNRFLVVNGISSEDIIHVIDNAECEICCATGRLLGLEYRHMACENCWKAYIRTKIENGQCLIGCMDSGCLILISNGIIEICGSSELKISHRWLIKDSFVRNDSSLAWCIKKCGMAVRRSNNDTVTCSCGTTFCFVCCSDAHYPASCHQIQYFEKQSMDSKRTTSYWILSDARKCPRCFVLIQKIGGCNHMTCTGCRYEYCWVCSQDWKTHSDSCRRADLAVAQSKGHFRTNSRISGQRRSRIENHKRYLNREEQTVTECRFRNTLVECRRTLMNSYVFGYYLANRTYIRTLERYQENLEYAVDTLLVFKNGPRAVALAEECITLRKALLDHCAIEEEHDVRGEEEGLEEREPVERATTDSYGFVEFCFDILVIVVVIIVVVLVMVFYQSFVFNSEKI